MQWNNLAPGRAYHTTEQFGAWQGLPSNLCIILIFLALFAPGRAYYAIGQFGARQGLPCSKSVCLYPSGLISNLAPGRAYHAMDLKPAPLGVN